MLLISLITVPTFAAVSKLEYKVPEQQLFARMFLKKELTMPQVKIFNKYGVEIYSTNELDLHLKNNALQAIKNNNVLNGENSFNQFVRGATNKDGQTLSLNNLADQELILVESWCAWFDKSQQQRENITALLDELTDKKVTWIALDVDPKKMKNVTIKTVE
jgi:hypothetical protein